MILVLSYSDFKGIEFDGIKVIRFFQLTDS